MFNGLKKLDQFDKITKYRLQNSFIYALGINLIIPIMIDLKGEYLIPWVISMFLVVETLVVKTNNFMTKKFSMETLYKMGIFAHLLSILFVTSYFINPNIMIYGNTIIMIFHIAIFSAYSIKLNNYLISYYPDSFHSFQVIRNSIIADGTILGLSLITFILYFFDLYIGLMFFIGFNLLFVSWMFFNFNIFKNIKD